MAETTTKQSPASYVGVSKVVETDYPVRKPRRLNWVLETPTLTLNSSSSTMIRTSIRSHTLGFFSIDDELSFLRDGGQIRRQGVRC